MQKGAFTGKKLSDLKPKDNNATENETNTGPTKTPVGPAETAPRPAASSQAVHKEAQNRIGRVFKEALDAGGLDDYDKEYVALEILKAGPKEVRAKTLELLGQSVAAASKTQAKQLRKLRRELVLYYPSDNPDATVETFFDWLEHDIMPDEHTEPMTLEGIVYFTLHHTSAYPKQLEPALLLGLAAFIEKLRPSRPEEEYQKAKTRLHALQYTEQELHNATKQTASTNDKAKVLFEEIMARLQANQTTNQPVHAFVQQLRKQSANTISKTPKDVMAPLARLMLGAMQNITNNETHFSFWRYLFLTALACADERDLEAQAMLLEHVSGRDEFHPYQYHDEQETRMQLFKRLVALRQLPGLVAAVLRRTQAGSYQINEVNAVVRTLPFNLNPGEAWSDQALNDLAAMPPATRESWMRFLQHANSDKSKPSAAWEKTCAALVATLPDFQAHVPGWLALVGKARTHTLFKESYVTSDPNDRFDPWNANIVRGLVWSLACVAPNEDNARACANIVETSLKKVPGVGPRSPKLATAGVVALGHMNTSFAIAQLARLKARVGFKTTLKEIEKALEESALRAGISKADLEEIAVPTFGLDANGKRSETLGAYRLELLCHNNDVQLVCFDANNKQLKSIPAALKKDFDAELKDFKTAQKDVAGMVSAIKNRLEKLHISQKTWSLHDWQERYMQHPLVGRVAERLIWSIDGQAVAMHPQRGLEGLRGEKHKFSDTARVALWHPIQASAEDVLAWRNWLHEAGVVQPWKQAHRELYLLTAAEERTRVYSNRFAAHILKQHQFAQLASLRGWNNRLRLMVDDSYAPPTLELPEWNLRAEYWVEGLGDNYGADTTETGTYLRLMTDQVRFYPLGAPQNHAHAGGGGYEMWLHNGANPVQPLPLDQVPALVLSEVLRDVDLFVGVCSVGNDPTWQDGGPEGRYREYWQSYSFGDLNATAVTRKEMLELLLPRLKIRDRATLEGKFLKIRGDVRTYKIHLGSSNILMEPNDEYLCIVPGAGMDNDRVHLPFEGDRMLALVLSKAFMLADDTKITDTTITRQLRR